MIARRVEVAAGGLLVISALVAVLATWLGITVADVRRPPGTASGAPAVFTWLMLGFTGVGALVAARRRSNPIGWLLIAVGLLWQVNDASGTVRLYVGHVRSELPGEVVSAWVFDVLWILPVVLLPAIVLLFPTGRLPSPRWRWAMAALVVGGVALFVAVGLRPGPLTSTPVDNPLGIRALDGLAEAIELVGGLVFAVGTLAALVSLVSRFRRGDAIVRQQLRWIALAVAAVVISQLAGNVLVAAGAGSEVVGAVRLLPLVLVPVACGIAVLRYRLFDIDVVVSKALVYGALGVVIVGIYVVVVVLVGRAAGGRGEPNTVLAVVATAIAAMAFDPARRALQRGADRAVYGRRATPYEALAAMTRRVGSGYAPRDVTERMARAIAEATGGRGEVWVAGVDGPSRSACWPPPTPHRHSGADAADGTPTQVFPVHHDGKDLGSLMVTKTRGEPMTPAEHRLLTDLAHSAAVVLDNERLVDELRSSRQRLVAAQDDERRRVERDLHDGAQQRLLELALTLGRAERRLATAGAVDASPVHHELARTMAEASTQLKQALAELRDLARGIHPAILTEQGLEAALGSLASRLDVAADLEVGIGTRLDPVVESTAYFLVAEATSNVAKHAAASSVRIAATRAAGTLYVEVADDGVGGADLGGSGLQGLADRVAAVGGHFDVDSELGQGTRVRAVIPCA